MEKREFMNICLFLPEEINKPLNLHDERAQHILKILHKKQGDSFTAGVINGASGIATINKIEDAIYFDFEEKGSGKLLNPLKMIIGFPRPIQLKRLLRDIAALGVSEVHLTGTDLGEKSYMKSNLVEKGSAYKMLLDGTVQAGSTNVPELFLHQNLTECLETLKKSSLEKQSSGCQIIKIALDNVNPACSLNTALEKNENVLKSSECVAAIGSERGWTDKERNLLEKYGYVRCGMGERIMRTETAATVSASIILNKMGFLGE